MSKYFDDNGALRPEFMAKIEPLLKEADRRYDEEYGLMADRNKILKKALDDAEKKYLEAYRNRDAAYGKWLGNDQGFGLAQARNRQKKKIIDDCLKTFEALDDAESEADGKAKTKREISNNLMRMGINSTENPFIDKPIVRRAKTLRESIKEDEQEAAG